MSWVSMLLLDYCVALPAATWLEIAYEQSSCSFTRRYFPVGAQVTQYLCGLCSGGLKPLAIPASLRDWGREGAGKPGTQVPGSNPLPLRGGLHLRPNGAGSA